jgi:D-alanine transaminase/branched-chain amino acid aminotransferase
MINFHIINGELHSAAEANLNVTDLGLLRGYGIFDYFQIKEGKPFFMEDHLRRFYRSAERMQLEIRYEFEDLKAQVWQLIKANGTNTCGIRLVLTGGYSKDGFTPERSNLIILQHPFKNWDPAIFENGVRLITHEHVRTKPEVKTTNYYTAILLIPEMKAVDAIDVLYHDSEGWISETSRSNFFIINTVGTLITTKDRILKGITREYTLQVAKGILPVEERPFNLSDLESASEAFVTSTTKGIVPVVDVGGVQIGDGRPGPLTQKLMKALKDIRE